MVGDTCRTASKHLLEAVACQGVAVHPSPTPAQAGQQGAEGPVKVGLVEFRYECLVGV